MVQNNNIYKALTAIFLILAAAAVVCYFVFPDDKTIFLYCGGAAVCIRLTQYLMKFIM